MTESEKCIHESREEFEKAYLGDRASNPEFVKWFRETRLILPCSCDHGGGPWHYAVIQNTVDDVEDHFRMEAGLAEERNKENGND